MVKAYQKHPLEVRITRLVIALFTLAVLLGVYYVAGGPIPYLITWSGPSGESFTGRYEVVGEVSGSPEELLEGGSQFEAAYPYTALVWGSRRAFVVASAQNATERASLNTITVRRAGVVCTEAYRWGSYTSVVCDDKHSY